MKILKFTFVNLYILISLNSFADCSTDNCTKIINLDTKSISGNKIDVTEAFKKIDEEDLKNRNDKKSKNLLSKSDNKSYWRWYNSGILLAGITLTHLKKECVTGPWVSTHKTLHMTGNAFIVGSMNMTLDSDLMPDVVRENYEPAIGIAAGEIASFAREAYKVNHEGMACEWASMTWDAAGIALGAYLGSKITITINENGFGLVFRTKF